MTHRGDPRGRRTSTGCSRLLSSPSGGGAAGVLAADDPGGGPGVPGGAGPRTVVLVRGGTRRRCRRRDGRDTLAGTGQGGTGMRMSRDAGPAGHGPCRAPTGLDPEPPGPDPVPPGSDSVPSGSGLPTSVAVVPQRRARGRGLAGLNLLGYVFASDPGGQRRQRRRVPARRGRRGCRCSPGAATLSRRSPPSSSSTGGLTVTVPLSTHFGAVTRGRPVHGRPDLRRPGRGGRGLVTGVASLLSQSGGGYRPGRTPSPRTSRRVIVVGAALAVGRWQREVDANRRRLADRAVADERRRIARELHDIVAHHITTMQLMAAAPAPTSPAHRGGPGSPGHPGGLRAARPARDAPAPRRTAGRRRVENAPTQPQPGAGDLDRLVGGVLLAPDSRPSSAFTGRGRPLPPTVGLTVFRIVQEALTNARKHAGPAHASVRLTYRKSAVTVEVSDDGTAGASRTSGDPRLRRVRPHRHARARRPARRHPHRRAPGGGRVRGGGRAAARPGRGGRRAEAADGEPDRGGRSRC